MGLMIVVTDRNRISVVDFGKKYLYNKNSNLDLITLLGVANHVLSHFHIKIRVFIVAVGSRRQDRRQLSQAMHTFVIDILYRPGAKIFPQTSLRQHLMGIG